jgi:rod shape-determining protein MreD
MASRTQETFEIARFPAGMVLTTVFMSLFLQAFLPRYFPSLTILDLPLLALLYFGLSRRNPATGLLMGTFIGLMQDGLSHQPIGMYGIVKTGVGFLASSLSGRIDTEHPIVRWVMGALLYLFHQLAYAGLHRWLVARPAELSPTRVLVGTLVNAFLAVLVFPLLDRFKKPA